LKQVEDTAIAKSTLYRWVKDTILTTDFFTADYTTLQRKSQQFDHILQIIRLSIIIDEVSLQRQLTIGLKTKNKFQCFSFDNKRFCQK